MKLGLFALVVTLAAGAHARAAAQSGPVAPCAAASSVAADFLAHREVHDVVAIDRGARSLNEHALRDLKFQGVDLTTVRRSNDDAGGWVGGPPTAALVSAFMTNGSINAATACPNFLTSAVSHGARLSEPKRAHRNRQKTVYYLRISRGAANADGHDALISIEFGCNGLCGGGRLLHLQLQGDGNWKTIGAFPLWVS